MTSTGFSFKCLTNKEITALQDKWLEEVFSWRKDKVLRTMGMLNAYVYHAAIGVKALTRDKEGNLRVNQQKLQQLAHNKITFTVTIEGLRTYLLNWWNQASRKDEDKGVRANTLRSLRETLAETFQLFTYTSQKFGFTRKSPDLVNFDISRALILHELLERLLMEKFAPEVADRKNRLRAILPDHLGYCCVKLFNALFDGVRSFMRQAAKPYEDVEVERPSEGRLWLDRLEPDWERPYTINSNPADLDESDWSDNLMWELVYKGDWTQRQWKTDEPATLSPELWEQIKQGCTCTTKKEAVVADPW